MPNLLCLFATPRPLNPPPHVLKDTATGEFVPVHLLGLDRKLLYKDCGSCRALILAEYPLALEESPDVAATLSTPVWVSPTLKARFGPEFGLADLPADRNFGNGCWSGKVLVRDRIEHLSSCLLSTAGALQAQANPAMLERLRLIFED